MLSMARANLYRMIKAPYTWAFLICFIVAVCINVWSTWYFASTGPYIAPGGLAISSNLEVRAAQAYGLVLATGAAVPLCGSILIASFFSADFKTKAVKNIVQVKGGRLFYALSSVAVIVVVNAALIVVGIVVAELFFRALGFTIVSYDAGELALLLGQMLLVGSAYSAITVLVVFATGNESIGVVTAIFVSSGFLENVIRMVLANTFADVPLVRDCLDGYLSVQLGQLAKGSISDAAGWIAAAVTVAVAVAVCVLIMKKKELAK